MGWEKGKRKGNRASNHFFHNPLLPTFGMFEIIRFQLPNCWNNLSRISRKIISHGANPLHNREQLECKKQVGRQHTTFTLCQNAACSNEYFLLQLDYALEGLHFDWANYVIFATCFIQKGRDTTKAYTEASLNVENYVVSQSRLLLRLILQLVLLKRSKDNASLDCNA